MIVLNKIDRVDPLGRRRLTNRFPDAPQVSAVTGEGLVQVGPRLVIPASGVAVDDAVVRELRNADQR